MLCEVKLIAWVTFLAILLIGQGHAAQFGQGDTSTSTGESETSYSPGALCRLQQRCDMCVQPIPVRGLSNLTDIDRCVWDKINHRCLPATLPWDAADVRCFVCFFLFNRSLSSCRHPHALFAISFLYISPPPSAHQYHYTSPSTMTFISLSAMTNPSNLASVCFPYLPFSRQYSRWIVSRYVVSLTHPSPLSLLSCSHMMLVRLSSVPTFIERMSVRSSNPQIL